MTFYPWREETLEGSISWLVNFFVFFNVEKEKKLEREKWVDNEFSASLRLLPAIFLFFPRRRNRRGDVRLAISFTGVCWTQNRGDQLFLLSGCWAAPTRDDEVCACALFNCFRISWKDSCLVVCLWVCFGGGFDGLLCVLCALYLFIHFFFAMKFWKVEMILYVGFFFLV